ncbi:right-handed parallel beta-helix repeat-containing protein [Calditrichota bacterium]
MKNKTTVKPAQILIITMLMMILPQPLHAAIINVPEDFELISWALGVAEEGDTIIVQPGEYEEAIAFTGEQVTLASLFLITGERRYIDSTVIAPPNSQALYIDHGEDSTTIVSGLTIKGGEGQYGGGIYVSGSSPILTDLVVTENESGILGGGIYCTQGGKPLIRNCRIEYNTTSGSGGGIAVAHGAQPRIEGCVIFSNTAAVNGGGVFAGHGEGSFKLSYTEISYNQADSGGGIFTNTVYTCSATNLTIARNMAEYGGGIAVGAGGEDGGMSYFSLKNSIVWDNDSPQLVMMTYRRQDIGIAEFDYCDLAQVYDAYIADSCRYFLNDCLSDDPLFVDSDNADFHLDEDSPCIDTGDPDGLIDPDSTRLDMGAYPFDQRLTVDGLIKHPPVSFTLLSLYPNPFNAQLNIQIMHPVEDAAIEIFDLTGKRIVSFASLNGISGIVNCSWDAHNHPAGTYLVRYNHPLSPTVQMVTLLK